MSVSSVPCVSSCHPSKIHLQSAIMHRFSLASPHVGIGNGIEDFKVNDPDDGMLGGFTCLKRHLLIGASPRLRLITRQGIPGARLPPSYPADLNLSVIWTLHLSSWTNTFVKLDKYICPFGQIHLSICRNSECDFISYRMISYDFILFCNHN